jgi:tRNA(Glu) U13 pseudouridine synthase TruD
VHQRMQARQTLIDGDIVTWVEEWHTQYGLYDKSHNMVTPIFSKGKSDHFFLPAKASGDPITYREEMAATGPVPWFDTIIPLKGTESGESEFAFLQEQWLNDHHMQIFREMKIYGLRRALWVTPSDVWVRYQDDDLLIDFTLPSGSYASVPIRVLMRDLKIREARSLIRSRRKTRR